MLMLKSAALVAASFAGVQLMSAHVETSKPAADYTRQIEGWRAQRVERLKAPGGWLSLIGLHWLKDGANSVGSAKGNDIVLAKGPARLGTITLKDGKATIALDAKAGATIDGKPAQAAELLDDAHEHPTTVAFGSASFHVIDRNGKKALRVKDSEAKTRTGFRLTTRGASHLARVLPARVAPNAQHLIEKVPPDLSKFLIAPMPGLLVRLDVGEGDKVEAGQPLAVVEAMKMENILRAEKAAVVKTVAARAGDSLAVDQVILELE